MPGETQDVKSASSTDSVKVAPQATGDELASVKSENERFKGVISTLQAERDEARSRLDELNEKDRLSTQERLERQQLMRKDDTYDDMIEELRRKPEAKPWFKHVEKELSKLKQETDKAAKVAEQNGKTGALMELAADYVEDMAEKEGIKSSDFLKSLKPHLSQFDDKNPYRRTQLAYKSWQEAQSLKKERDELAKAKAALETREDGGRMSRESSAEDLIKKKGDLDVSEKSLLREKLGIMTRQK